MGTPETLALELPQRYLGMVQAILRERAPGAEVWAYGSRVTGGGHEASDLDLVVRRPGELEQETAGMSRLRAAFPESNLPIRVDVFDWARIPEAHRAEIAAGYVVVQGGEEGRRYGEGNEE